MVRMAIVMLLLIVVVFSASGCGNSNNDKKVQAKASKENVTEQAQQVIPPTNGALSKLKVPSSFRPIGWLTDIEVIGLKGEQLINLNLQTGKEHKLGIKGWNASLAPANQLLAYDDEQGIWLYSFATGKSRLVWERSRLAGEGELAYLWSKTSRQLLISHVYEWDGEHFALDIETGKELALKTELNNYFLTFPVGWLNDDTVLFETRASVSEQGSQEYSFGYRGDLMVVRLSENQPKLLTRAKDGEFISCNSIDNDVIKALIDREQQQPSLVELSHEGKILKTTTLNDDVRFVVNRGKKEAMIIEQDQQNSQLVSSFTVKTVNGKALGQLEGEAIIGIVENESTGQVLLALLENSQAETEQQNGIWLVK